MSQQRVPTLPRPGIFVMRDGVICQRDETSTKQDAGIDLLPGALEGLRLFARLDMPVIVLNCHHNAAGAVGPLGRRQTDDAQRLLRSTLRTSGARVDGIRSYPMAQVDGWPRERKALVQLLHRAARLYTLDLATSVLVGDSWSTVQAAMDVQCQPVLVMTGRGREQITLPQSAALRSHTWYVADLASAALSVDAYFSNPKRDQTVA